MRLLLDTHAALWWFLDDDRLSTRAAANLSDPKAEVVFSAVNVWEVAVKHALGKLRTESLLDLTAEAGLDVLPITGEHAQAAGELPRHHNDPFDRLLVAQARVEGLALVSRDARLAAYDVPILW